MNKDQIIAAFKVIEQNAAEAKLTLAERIQSQEALKLVWAFIQQAEVIPPTPAPVPAVPSDPK